MIQFEELRLRLLESEKPLKELAAALGLEEMAKEVAALEEKTAAEDFWGDLANSQKVLQRIAALKNKIKAYEDLNTAFDTTTENTNCRAVKICLFNRLLILYANPAFATPFFLLGRRV